MGSNHHGLVFLLSLGGLPLACGPDDSPDDASTGTTEIDGDATDGSSSVTAGDETGLPPLPEHPACIAYHDLWSGCLPDDPEIARAYAHYCEAYIDLGLRLDGQACADLLAATFVCISKLDCELVLGDNPQCVAEAEAAEAGCPKTLGR